MEASITACDQAASPQNDTLADIIRSSRLLSKVPLSAPSPRSSSSLDISALTEVKGRFLSPSGSVPWHVIEDAIQECGYDIREVCPQKDPSDKIVNRNSTAPLVEVVSRRDGFVIAGGKGTHRTAATQGALGEFAERFVASSGGRERIFATSADNLRDRGFIVPGFFAGLRDCYSSALVHDWVSAYTLQGAPAALPAERAFYDYVPQSGVRAFAWQHTMGLAAGATLEEAVWAGLTECLERDAYWLVMRCRLACPTLDSSSILAEAAELRRFLDDAGVKVVFKNISLDWPLAIVHAILIDPTGRIPAFSHGVGSGSSYSSAGAKALLESFQIRAGLIRLCAADIARSVIPAPIREAERIWTDPASVELLRHLIIDPEIRGESLPQTVLQPADIIREVESSSGPIFYAPLGSFHGLEVVRVYIPGSLQPDPTVEDAPTRLQEWLRRSGLPAPYPDPILT